MSALKKIKKAILKGEVVDVVKSAGDIAGLFRSLIDMAASSGLSKYPAIKSIFTDCSKNDTSQSGCK
ncbi:hypothetical protein [Candidatus Magnetomonas plexicatena]|uniref:hypothetical protein n=1 Tax=Candidatus Magnetomonas plexicatena TaxID=2552947 RepID=UPI001102B82F|nr:hypothetical protein E2O03_013560 [Nitrospirales bacterium LBB_01]